MTNAELFAYLDQNEYVSHVIENASVLRLKNWYVGAGAICQTVWNIKHDYQPHEFVKDIDLIYFDDSDTSSESEQNIRDLVKRTFNHLPIPIDVTNQARVHLWYEQDFGFKIPPYQSSEDAINSWPTTASSIGVSMSLDKHPLIHAPFGLNDIDAMVVRPNKKLVTKEIYESKAHKWKKRWPGITVVEW